MPSACWQRPPGSVPRSPGERSPEWRSASRILTGHCLVVHDMNPLDLLAEGVPITLLMDLARPDGPVSHRLLIDEKADLGWLQKATA